MSPYVSLPESDYWTRVDDFNATVPDEFLAAFEVIQSEDVNALQEFYLKLLLFKLSKWDLFEKPHSSRLYFPKGGSMCCYRALPGETREEHGGIFPSDLLDDAVEFIYRLIYRDAHNLCLYTHFQVWSCIEQDDRFQTKGDYETVLAGEEDDEDS